LPRKRAQKSGLSYGNVRNTEELAVPSLLCTCGARSEGK
jgi:hypothetical protein